jgi:hypothetical protein
MSYRCHHLVAVWIPNLYRPVIARFVVPGTVSDMHGTVQAMTSGHTYETMSGTRHQQGLYMTTDPDNNRGLRQTA